VETPISDGDGSAARLGELARAADLCFGPLRHALRLAGGMSAARPSGSDNLEDCLLLIEARDDQGVRQPGADLELEIFRSGNDLHLMLSRVADAAAPLLWHGSHSVWMRADSGERCACPADGMALEAFCRRVRALLAGR
jgi:hypothetical protein